MLDALRLTAADPLWGVHAAVTWALVGLIWVVHIVIYPLFQRVPAEAFTHWHADYTRRIGWVVGPLMVVELITGAMWCFGEPIRWEPWVGAGLILAVWGSTAMIQVPLHAKLSQRWSSPVAHRLLHTNALRTLLWSLRGCLIAVVGYTN
jgi:hypothetical protein